MEKMNATTTSTPPDSKPKPRWLKRTLKVVGSLVLLILFFYAEEDIRGRLAWEHFKATWTARGEKFTLAEIAPPPVPDEGNFALAPVVASSYQLVTNQFGHRVAGPQASDTENRLRLPVDFNGDGPNGIGSWQKATLSNFEPWQKYYRDLAARTNIFPISRRTQTPAADVLLALSIHDTTLEDLRRAAELPGSRFPLNYELDDPDAMRLPHLLQMKRSAVVLQMRALAKLQEGEGDQALADMGLALRLADKIHSEPTLLSQLVRGIMVSLTIQPVWEGLAQHRWTDAQLVQLDRDLAGFDFVADFTAACRAENAMQAAAMDFFRRHPERIPDLANLEQLRPALPLEVRLMPSGWFYLNELCTSRIVLEKFLTMADPAKQTIPPKLADQAEQVLENLPDAPLTIFPRILLPVLWKSAQRFAPAQNAVNMARVACALERFHLAHDKYPDALDEIAPLLDGHVPHDVIDGRPLHYHTSADGQFVLYSIGWNDQDDGGVVGLGRDGTMLNPQKGDWVWRYPGS